MVSIVCVFIIKNNLVGKVVGYISAEDEDLVDNIHYSIVRSSEVKLPFKLDSTNGVFTIKNKLELKSYTVKVC